MKHRIGGTRKGPTYADRLARERMIREAVKETAREARIQVETDIRCQRQLWLCCVALNEGFGFGPDRFKKFAEALTKVTEDYERLAAENDSEYANEKLRQRAEQISGMKIEYLYEHEVTEAKRRNEAAGILFSEDAETAAAGKLVDSDQFSGGDAP